MDYRISVEAIGKFCINFFLKKCAGILNIDTHSLSHTETDRQTEQKEMSPQLFRGGGKTWRAIPEEGYNQTVILIEVLIIYFLTVQSKD